MMEGDACSKHSDRMAVGYYGDGRSYGLNGCAECIKNNRGAKIQMYDLKKSKKIWNEHQKRELKLNRELLTDNSKSVEVSTMRGSHWVLFGQDKLDYLKDKSIVTYSMTFKDKRSYFYDSSD
jgi:hypothetical protein